MMLGVGNWDPLIVHYKGARREGVATLVHTGLGDSPCQVEKEGIHDFLVSVDGLCPASHPCEIPSRFSNWSEVGGPSCNPCSLGDQYDWGGTTGLGRRGTPDSIPGGGGRDLLV